MHRICSKAYGAIASSNFWCSSAALRTIKPTVLVGSVRAAGLAGSAFHPSDAGTGTPTPIPSSSSTAGDSSTLPSSSSSSGSGSGRAELKARAVKIDKIQRHIFLCCEQSKAAAPSSSSSFSSSSSLLSVGPKGGANVCCSAEEGASSWEFLKRRSRELNQQHSPFHIGRTKANCLQICHDGPIAVVYPEGVWCVACRRRIVCVCVCLYMCVCV